jgi:hypothetical protein
VRVLGSPDWSRISEHIEGQERIAAENGWFIAQPTSPIDYGTDQPCTVFLTNRGIYIDVRPDASVMGPETIKINPYGVERAGVALREMSNLRFACIYATNYGADGEIKSVAVDFEWAHLTFAVDTLEMWAQRFVSQTALAKSVLEDMERGQDDQHA